MSSSAHIPEDHKWEAYLFLTDKESERTLDAFTEIRNSVASPDNAYILFHQKNNFITDRLNRYAPFLFTYESLLKLSYTPIVMDIVPGSNHFPILQFFLEFPDYKYYWVIEDDVRFTGEWSYLFDFFQAYEHEFMSCHIRGFSDEPEWHWWQSLYHRDRLIPMADRIRSFNPIYRISGRALQFIHDALLDKWVGHHEVLLPTLLYHNGYKILDFGGMGDFVAEGNNNKFYTSCTSDPKGCLKEGTMRYRPVYEIPGDEKNKLYHPVKKIFSQS